MQWKKFTVYIKSWSTGIFLGYLIIIIYLSLTVGDELSWFSRLWKYDKFFHFTEYLVLGFLLINMLMIEPMKKVHWKIAIIFLFLFPIIDESLQYYTPGRIPDIYDGICDICGGFIGAYIRKII